MSVNNSIDDSNFHVDRSGNWNSDGSMRKMYAEGMPAVIAKLKELGITEIEGGGGRSMDRASFRKLAEENGMKIIATGGGNFDNLQNKDSHPEDHHERQRARRAKCYLLLDSA